MKVIRLIVFVAAGLLLQFNLAMAEPAVELPSKGEPEQFEQQPAASEVWGDPEADDEENESAWTWFGMGYELRNLRHSSTQPAPDVRIDDAAATAGGKLRQHK